MKLQRIRHQLQLSPAKTDASISPLPMPGICISAVRLRQKQQEAAKAEAAEAWQDEHGLVFTTRCGTPIEPRNFNRAFDARCHTYGVRRIRVHDIRHTCGSLRSAYSEVLRVTLGQPGAGPGRGGGQELVG
jgi:hypothetical protein